LARTTDALREGLNRAATTGQPAIPRRSGVPPAGERRFVPSEVVISLPSNLSPETLDALASRHGLTRLDSQSIGLTGTTFHRWRIADQRSVSEVVRALEADRVVHAAQPNYRFTLQQGQVSATQAGDLQYALAKLRLREAHRFATGGNILVAVIDSGVDTSHPEIAGMVADSFNAINSREGPHSHGTAMAGAIIANAQLRGVAPAARILAICAFDGSGAGTEGTTVTLLRSMDWAIARGARVLNMSFAGPSDPEDKLLRAANRGRHIALAAPGVDILAPAPHARYQTTSGTSIAAAHVSGLAALLLERKPDLTPDAVRKILLSTAADLGAKGRDDHFGAGLADAYGALMSLQGRPADRANVSAAR
jgi:subtilisin family serine protease